MYCEAVVRYEQAARLLSQSAPLIRGRRGAELVKNPLHQVVRDNAPLVRALAGDLGLTPAARVGLREAVRTSATPRGRLDALRERRARRLNASPAG
jgi:P27 family predicted phage terminase small subunit